MRFAPSPTGRLHVGNLRTALFNWLYARKTNGVFVLRVEDTDADRSDKRYEEQVLNDLRWLGLDWDEGVDVGGRYGPYRQTERFSFYRTQAERLLNERQAYYCFCSEEELQSQRAKLLRAGQSLRYSGKCSTIPVDVAVRRVRSGEKATVRLRVGEGRVGFHDLIFGPIEVSRETIGDFILLRSDGSAQYNFACANDDHEMSITHVIRGEGHISNTQRQLLIYEALGYTPPRFGHLSTILGPDGTKLSKRHGATSLDAFRSQGFLPMALLNYLALLGWTPPEELGEILSKEQLVAHFGFRRITKSPATFDIEKLKWVNRSHLRSLEESQLVSMARPFLVEAGVVGSSPSPGSEEFVRDVVKVLLKYVDTLADFGKRARELLEFNPDVSLKTPEVEEILKQDSAGEVIRLLHLQLEKIKGEIDAAAYRRCVLKVKELSGRKGRDLFRPIRVAITAAASGPELDVIIPILEKGAGPDLPGSFPGVRERVRRVAEWIERQYASPAGES